MQSLTGILTIATDPFCYLPVTDMDPTVHESRVDRK